MGFGWLFVGYFFACDMASLFSPLAVVMPIGYGMILFALSRLGAYHPRLRLCFFASFLLLPISLYYGVYGLIQLGVPLSFVLFDVTAFAIFKWIYFGVWCGFHFMLLFGISALCADVGHIGLQSMAVRNAVFVAIYAVFYTVTNLPFLAAYQRIVTVPLIILQIMCVFLNLWLFWKCYRTIVPETADVPEPIDKGGDSHEAT